MPHPGALHKQWNPSTAFQHRVIRTSIEQQQGLPQDASYHLPSAVHFRLHCWWLSHHCALKSVNGGWQVVKAEYGYVAAIRLGLGIVLGVVPSITLQMACVILRKQFHLSFGFYFPYLLSFLWQVVSPICTKGCSALISALAPGFSHHIGFSLYVQ